MQRFSVDQSVAPAVGVQSSIVEAPSNKVIGLVMFPGFSLPEASALAEIFHMANALARSSPQAGAYDIQLLSAKGGLLPAASSVPVWTQPLRQTCTRFHAIFLMGGAGIPAASRNIDFLTWLRTVITDGVAVYGTSESSPLIDAARKGRAVPIAADGSVVQGEAAVADRVAMADSALSLVRTDLGDDVSRYIKLRMLSIAPNMTTDIESESAPMSIRQRIQASAQWLLDNRSRRISIAGAAQIASMSERNFLRRFKMEMGLTPSEYLQRARLNLTCRLLAETDLPVDKIARRCGIGNGDRLAKIFRKCMSVSPTEYRSGALVDMPGL